MCKIRLLYRLLCILSVILIACNNHNSVKRNKGEKPFSKKAFQILGDTNYQAICYGGYRKNTRDSQPTLSQITEDMRILNAMGIKLLRTYNTHYNEIETLLQAITHLRSENSNFEMYVMLGVWIECENAWTEKEPSHDKENEKANAAEIKKAVELVNQYPEIIKMIAVGNEAMVKWATNYYVQPNVIYKWVNYLQLLKKKNQLDRDLWITSSDNFASWGGGDTSYHVDDLKKLYQAVDFVSIHTYPMHDTYYNPSFWGTLPIENQLSNETQIDSIMNRTLDYAKMQYLGVYNYMKSIGVNKPIHIGETGWSTNSNDLYGSKGTSACDEYKSARYYQLIREWTNKEKMTCFYFEAFDENWKDANNIGGSENHFGLFKINGNAKYALWNKVDKGVFKGLTRDGNIIEKTYKGNKKKLMKTVELPFKLKQK
jgi:exo-beta-1,3-glucanase (GH17 family)